MKKLLILLLLLGTYFFLPTPSSAQSGCCSYHGGESYCDSGTGRWICNDGTYSPTCTCGGGYQAPAYVPPPTCPSNAYWTGSSCSCFAGYKANGGSCISDLQYCWNTLGYNSTYNYGTGQCACSSGYVYQNGTCESGITYCNNNYGFNATFNYATEKCECRYGYVWNSSGTSCISEDESCQDQYGIMTRYDSVYNTCDCLSGYSIQAGQCLPNRIQYRTPVYQKTETILPTNTPVVPTPTYALHVTHKTTPTPRLTFTPSLTPTPTITKIQISPIQPQHKQDMFLMMQNTFKSFLKFLGRI